MEHDQLGSTALPAKPLLKPSTLKENCFILPGNSIFVDKVLPELSETFLPHTEFPTDYFVALHKLVSAPGLHYPAFTPNHMGARIPLQHTRLNIHMWRYHLTGYVQFLEHGFPLGLQDDSAKSLVSSLRNHGSSYQYFTYLDKFLSTGLERCELAGPCKSPPFTAVHVSPLMTAV